MFPNLQFSCKCKHRLQTQWAAGVSANLHQFPHPQAPERQHGWARIDTSSGSATQQRKPELREPESFINRMTMSAFSPEGGAVSIFQGCIYTCILEKIRERASQSSTSSRRLPPCFASDVCMTVMQREGQVEGEGHQVV